MFLFHKRMIVIRVGSLCVQLACLYDSWPYDGHTCMTHIRSVADPDSSNPDPDPDPAF